MFSVRFRLPVRLGLALAACLGLARADEFVTIDFPIRGPRIVATGLTAAPRQVATPDGMGYAEVLLRPVRRESRVFLTFVFNEDGGRGPAVFWSGDVSGRQVTISENIAEGVVGLNRRTVALPPEITAEAGRLYIMGRQDWLLRLRIDWCEPATTLVAADQERPALIAGGAVWLDRDTTGQSAMTPPDVWFGRVLDAALQDGVADLSQDTELVVPLTGAIGRTRLRARFLGLPLQKSVRVWVNGKLAGRLHPTVPGLTDAGYVRRGKRTTYAGWREGALVIEPELLREGENAILFQSPGRGVYLSGAALEIERGETSEEIPAEKSSAAGPGPGPSSDPVAAKATPAPVPEPPDKDPAPITTAPTPEPTPAPTPESPPAPSDLEIETIETPIFFP